MARSLGIDVGRSLVRVALLRSTLRRLAVEALREERIADHESVVAAIRAATSGLRADASAVALPGRQAFLRRIELPAAVQRELGSVLSHEVEATLPFELDDAVMDHRILRAARGGPQSGGRTASLSILAAVAQTDQVRDTINLIRRATGQDPARVAVGPLCLGNLCLLAPELGRGTCALLDLGEEASDLVVLQAGEPVFARTVSRGVAGLPATAEALGRELRQSLVAWRAEGGEPLAALYVVGIGRYTPGIEGFAATALGVEVRDLPPLGLEPVPEREQAAAYAKAIGLALGLVRRAVDLNLRRGPLEAQQSYRFLREKTPLLSGLAAAVAVSFGFCALANWRGAEAKRVQLEEQLGATTRELLGQEVRDPAAARELLAKRSMLEDPMPELDGFDVVVELSRRVPESIVHDVSELDYNRGAVVINGIVPSIDDAHVVAAKMGEHDCFQDVKISRTAKLGGEERQKYVLELNVACGDPKKKNKKKPAAASGTAAPSAIKGAER
ncbi:MAG: pilus assembly protein PilM [Deltaproteobacteria bacterium]|nr:pilus assembly protein PilM [Deltaproteobacteria bacterium]